MAIGIFQHLTRERGMEGGGRGEDDGREGSLDLSFYRAGSGSCINLNNCNP